MKHLKPLGQGAFYSLVIAALALALMLLPSTFAGVYLAPDEIWLTVGVAVGIGVLGYSLIQLTRRLARRLGPITATAALVGSAAIVGSALALVLPQCPGAFTGEVCTVPQATTLGFSMSIMIAMVGATFFVARGGVKNFRKLGGKIKGDYKKVRDAKKQQNFEKEVSEGRRAAKRRDPQAKKGYPTPKQPKQGKKKALKS